MAKGREQVYETSPAEQSQAGDQGNRPSGGKPQDLRPDDKAHWKLRALANIRRHSDSDIFVSVAHKRYTAGMLHPDQSLM